MANPAHAFVDALVMTYTPLVSHAISTVMTRLATPDDAERLATAAMAGLLTAAQSYTGPADAFGAPARRAIATAMRSALVPSEGSAQAVPGGDGSAGNHLLAQLPHPDGAELTMLQSAHPDAFRSSEPRATRPAGHYSAVAAATEYRHSLEHRAGVDAQRKFGT